MTNPSDAPLAVVPKRSLADTIVVRLREAILAGSLAPGEHLNEVFLAERLGVSRGPIREALVELEREGLIVRTRHKGAVVARLSRTDLEEVCSLRLALERLAVQRAVQHATDEQLAALQAQVDVMRERGLGIMEREAADVDLRFHEILFQASHHQRLIDCWTQLQPQILVLLLARQVVNLDFIGVVANGHQELLDALRDRDEARALALIETHLGLSYDRVVAGYEHKPR